MRDSLYGYMRIGVVHFKAFPDVVRGEGDIVGTLRKICEDDFWTAVEVGWMKDIKVRDEARAVISQSHITAAYACQPSMFSQKLSLNHLDSAERTKALNQIRNCITEAYQLGAKSINVFSGKDPGDAKRDEAKKLLIDSLIRICDWAKDYDLDVHMKIFDRDVDKAFLIGPFSDALEIAQAVRPHYNRFGLLSDLSHFPLLREDPRTSVKLVKDYLVHFHIGNCISPDKKKHFLYGDLQPRFGIEDGEIDTPEVAGYFRCLVEEGLLNPADRPIVSAEVRPLLQHETSELILANTKRVIKEAWALA
ncbi:MAG: sugar phosphate isomerase/epimerase [Spirochaetales bacterium]|nr:sugar phosphate isomerase/epimerase [Spirochaetales bacterium]